MCVSLYVALVGAHLSPLGMVCLWTISNSLVIELDISVEMVQILCALIILCSSTLLLNLAEK